LGSARGSRAGFGDPPKSCSNAAKRSFKWRQSRARVEFPAGRRKPPASRRRSPEHSAQSFMVGLAPALSIKQGGGGPQITPIPANKTEFQQEKMVRIPTAYLFPAS